MTSSLVVVTCFEISFALRSDATARLILDASLSLALHAGCRSHAFELFEISSFSDKRLLFSLYLLLCTVFLLNAAVLVDLALYLAVGGLCLGLLELSCSLSLSCFKHVRHRFFGCLSLEPFSCSLSPSQARRLEVGITAPGDRAAVCSRSGVGMFRTLLRVTVWITCTVCAC